MGIDAGIARTPQIRDLVTDMPFSDLQIRKIKPKDKPFRLSDGLGLHLMVKPNGSKLWQFCFRYMGKEKLLSLGQYPIVSLANARKKRNDAKRLLKDGTDPSIQKKVARINAQVKVRMTFKEVAEEYYQGLVERGLAPPHCVRSVGKLKVWQSRFTIDALIKLRQQSCCTF